MPYAIQTFPDGSSERVFYADPIPIFSASQIDDAQHQSLKVDDVIHLDGDLDQPLVIKKTLTQAQKYMVCKTDEEAEQFSVNGIGQVVCQDLGCQEVEATESVSVGPSNDKIMLASVDTNDVRIYKNLYMEPSGNPSVHPIIMTRGSIVTLQDGFFAYVPTEGEQAIPGHVYTFGRQEFIGDLTHDNDGMNMRKTVANQDDPNQTLHHRIHLCPDPTDPSILICSKKHTNKDGFDFEGDYIQCRNVGPETPPTDANIVFQVNKDGDIKSQQIDNLVKSTTDNYADMTGLFGQLETLDNEVKTNENNIRYDLIGIQDKILNNETDIGDNNTNITALNTDVDALVTDVLNNNTAVTSLATIVTDNGDILSNTAAIANNNTNDIATNTSAISTAETDIVSIELSVAAHATAITELQNSSGGGGIETYDITTHDSKDIGAGGDYDNDNWGDHNNIREVPWGANPTSLTILVRAAGYMYLPNPNNVNLTPGNVVVVIFAPKHSHNCTLNVKVHDEAEAWISHYNDQSPDTVYGLVESRVGRFIYLGTGYSVSGNFVDYSTMHRWLVEHES